jgi:hypothetical protein
LTPLVEQIAAAVRDFGLVFHDMSEHGLADLAGKIRSFRRLDDSARNSGARSFVANLGVGA